MPEPLTVVLVEDHDDLREEMLDYLRRPQWRVLGADSGAALNQWIARHPIDVVVLDVNLPGEDGFSIAQRLRATHPGLGIVLLTARTRPSDRSTGYRAGGDVYLTSPTCCAGCSAPSPARATNCCPGSSNCARPAATCGR